MLARLTAKGAVDKGFGVGGRARVSSRVVSAHQITIAGSNAMLAGSTRILGTYDLAAVMIRG